LLAAIVAASATCTEQSTLARSNFNAARFFATRAGGYFPAVVIDTTENERRAAVVVAR
jgi:hypothetical protein